MFHKLWCTLERLLRHNPHRLSYSASCFSIYPSSIYKSIYRIHVEYLVGFRIRKIFVPSKISLHFKEILTLFTSIYLSILYQTI
nr:MAG TPA: hypothetical protein [Bacteriophage sp.]